MTLEESFTRYTSCLASLTAESLDQLEECVGEEVRFKDPFHDLKGITKMQDVFRHLFESVDDLEYTILDPTVSQDGAYFRWHLSAKLSGNPWTVEGVTFVQFDANLNISEHIEYWDAASQLYERFPVIGSLLALLRRRIAAA